MATTVKLPVIEGTAAQEERCETCKYTLKLPDGRRVCRRFPPAAQPPDSNSGLAFVKDDWWCGEYERDTK